MHILTTLWGNLGLTGLLYFSVLFIIFRFQVMHIGECQMLHRPQGGLEAMQNGITATEDTEVISFYPG